MSKKLAIIALGGGMTCSYTVGVVQALIKEYGVTKPDIVIASSGSAGTMSYYIAEQYDSILNIWTNLLSTKKFINIFRLWRIIDIDYLIDIVFKKQDPLSIEKVMSSEIIYLIPVTNHKIGEIRYLSNKNHDDIFEAMRATKAIPLAYNKKVIVNGNMYCDSFLSASSNNLHIQKAVELGATHIILIDNNDPNFLTRIGFDIWFFFRSRIFKRNYHSLEDKAKRIHPNDIANVIELEPKTKLEISTLNNNKDLLSRTIILGYNECKNDDHLKKFLKEFAAKEKLEIIHS